MTTEKCKSLQYYSPNFSRFPPEIFILLSWCSRWPIHHQVIVHSLTLPLSALTAIISLESFTPETHKRQEVSCNWKLGLCIQVTYLIQGYLILLTQIVTDSAVQTHPHGHTHTHTHTYLHLQMNSLSELTLPDIIDHSEVFQKPSPNNW